MSQYNWVQHINIYIYLDNILIVFLKGNLATHFFDMAAA